MSIFDSIGNALGIGGEAGTKTNRTVDPLAWQELFNQATSTLQSGMQEEDPQQKALRDAINNQAMQRLQSMQGANNDQKAQFLKDQGNVFASNQQNTARARGGTGTMAQAFTGGNQGQAYTAAAEGANRGLLNLNQQQGQELGSVSGIAGQTAGQGLANRGQLFGQKQALANQYAQELNNRRNLETGNNTTLNNAASQNMDRGMNTFGGIARLAFGA